MKKSILLLAIGFLSLGLMAQLLPESVDSSHYKYLPNINWIGRSSRSDWQLVPEIVGTSIYAGKKSSVLVLKNVEGNVATNTMRQIMAKIPGIQVWESDGSGIQIGVASRGLSPNRSWEFNVRQNGYDIAADPYGYPEAYYNPQLQAVQRIEIIRGHGALQYGPQFGGMINYLLRDGSEFKKPIQLETQQTIGSFGLYNHFTGVGGRSGKWHYYSFFDRRQATGFRANSRYFTNAGFATTTYQATPKLSVTLEYMRSHIRSQQPGGLTDSLLQIDAKKSFRARNWMDIDWTTAALRWQYAFSENSRLEGKLFTLIGDRNSVGFLPNAGIIRPDTIDPTNGLYAPRNLNIDRYRNSGLEIRWIGDASILNKNTTFSAGLRWFRGKTHRRAADGKGSTGTQYDMNLVDGIWIRDLNFNSRNYAAFSEAIIRPTSRLSIIPGIRYEWVEGNASGQNNIQNGMGVYLIPQSKSRGFVLGGIGSEYHLNKKIELYANISEAYRPVQFADLSTPPGTDRIDPALQDARGYNADLGIRGKIRNGWSIDASLFLLRYGNRIGTLLEQDLNGQYYNLRTNIGRSVSKGLELFTEYQGILLRDHPNWKWNAFISYAWNRAVYQQLRVTRLINDQLQKFDLKNNRVENAPEHILRSGLGIQYKKWKWTTQYSYVSGTYSDANNTIKPSNNGQNGWIISYGVIDLTLSWEAKKNWSVRTGINNLLDKKYFTRRAGGYPGPGALPADGRSAFITVTYQFH